MSFETKFEIAKDMAIEAGSCFSEEGNFDDDLSDYVDDESTLIMNSVYGEFEWNEEISKEWEITQNKIAKIIENSI